MTDTPPSSTVSEIPLPIPVVPTCEQTCCDDDSGTPCKRCPHCGVYYLGSECVSCGWAEDDDADDPDATDIDPTKPDIGGSG